MKRIMFVIPVVALFVGTFLPSTSFAQCLFNCSMGSTSPSPDWDLSQSGRLEMHFDEGAKCRAVYGDDSDMCPREVLGVKPETVCAGPACNCPESGNEGSVHFTLKTRNDFLVFGEFIDKVRGKDTVLARGCFKFEVVHYNADVEKSGDACQITQFANPDSTQQMKGSVSRSTDSMTGADACGITDVIPRCESAVEVNGKKTCVQLIGGQVLRPNKLSTAWPPTDELEPGQTLLARQDANGGSFILSRPCTGEQNQGPSSIECIDSGKPHDADMDADLAALCAGDWYAASVNANGSNPHKYAIIDQGNCNPENIDVATVEINGAPAFGCQLKEVGGIAAILDLVCSAIEGQVAENPPVASGTSCASSDDDGKPFTVAASGVVNDGGDGVPLEAFDQVLCKFN